MKERRAYIVLVLISIVLTVMGVLYEGYQRQTDDHKFCQVIGGVTSVHVVKPADPAKDPSRERAWQWYKRFTDLSNSLGCSLGEK